MSGTRVRGFIAILISVGTLAGCGGSGPRLGTLSPDALYSGGIAAYEQREYGRAIEFLEAFVQRNLGDPRVPEARITLGRAHMARREYIAASSEFQRLVTDFPNSPLNREARYGMCEAYFRLSPEPPLDQEYTYSAIAHCESVANLFPGTEEGERAAAHVAELREKLAHKTFDTGVFYFRRGAYDAGVIYFEDVVRQFPQTSYAPAALLKLIESYDRIGYVEEAADARERLMREYPESPEAQALQARSSDSRSTGEPELRTSVGS